MAGKRRHEIAKGAKFKGTKLTAIAEVEPLISPSGSIRRRVLCKCDCGKEKIILLQNILNGHTISCGCLGAERTRERFTKHGLTTHNKQHPLYGVWKAMKRRCDNPNSREYKWYGARGIVVCKEWYDPKAFFDWATSNGYRPGLELDRIDNNGNYEPSNCRFTSHVINNRNKRDNHIITMDGKTQCISEWAEETGIQRSTLFGRIQGLNWDAERALTTPVKKKDTLYSYDGRTQTLKSWEAETGIPYATLSRRIRVLNWDIRDALTIPVDVSKRNTHYASK